MKELMYVIADAAPREAIVEMISQAVSDYNVIPSEENYGRLVSSCAILLAKATIERSGLDAVMKETELMDKTRDLLRPNQA